MLDFTGLRELLMTRLIPALRPVPLKTRQVPRAPLLVPGVTSHDGRVLRTMVRKVHKPWGEDQIQPKMRGN